MGKRSKQIFINITILTLSIFVSLLALEALIRVFALTPAQRDHKLFMEYDQLLGWKKKPNFVGEHVTSEYTTEESINSASVRGPEYPYEKPGDEYRIVILGDSFAEGYTVEFEELFSEVLKRNLNDAAGNMSFEVINLGTGGYSTDQQLLLFQTEGKKYSPDLTILMFYDNDIWYNNQSAYWRGNKPLYRLAQDGSLQLTNVPVPEADILADSEINDDQAQSAFTRWLAEKSQLYQFVLTRAENTPTLHRLGIKLGLISDEVNGASVDGHIPIPDEYRIYKKEPDDDIAQAWTMTEALIARLAKESDAVGSELLLFHVPPRYSIYDKYWAQMKAQYELSEDDWSIKEVENRLKQLCEDRHLVCIAPQSDFKREASRLRADGDELYFVEDRHWNVLGHRLAGRILAEYIAGT